MTEQATVELCQLTADEKRVVKEALSSLWPLYEEGKIPGSVIAQLGALVGYPAPEGYPQPQQYPYPQPYPKVASESSDLESIKQLLTKAVDKDELKQEITKALESAERAWAEREKALAEALNKAEARLQELEKALEAEREAKEQVAALSELRERFPNIATAAPQVIEELVRIRKSELYESVLKLLGIVEGMFKQAPLLKELGERGQDGDPLAELEREARNLVEKGEVPTLEKARVKVLERRPDLYRALRGGV